jgi:putative Mn2+ efflux pump MntP
MLSLAAIALGNRLSVKFGSRMEIIGGIILVGIGLRICLSYLFS